MSINAETAKAHANDPAVTCCRFEAGNNISHENLESPDIFPDLEESGLLDIPDDCLKIGEVLGAKITKTIDALTPITKDFVDESTLSKIASDATNDANHSAISNGALASSSVISGRASAEPRDLTNTVKIHIGEGKDINLEFPISFANSFANQASEDSNANSKSSSNTKTKEDKITRKLLKKHYKIEKVELSDKTEIIGSTLKIRESILKEAIDSEDIVLDMKIEIITPNEYSNYSETIMDIQPIATKESGEIGSGVTRVIDGVIVMVTGTDENGVQIGEFGSSEGILERNIMWNRPGAADKGDIFIKTNVTIKEHMNMERPGPLAAHKATDVITNEIRKALKECDEKPVSEEELVSYRRYGKKKVLIIKEIMGQGAMHDNLILPTEPVGILGASANVDLGNLPIMLSPTEVLDGGIHALTCIGPASKETSRHYWREPLVIEAMNDEEIDLCGVLFVGSPQINSEKFYVSKRLGAMVEALDLDGAIITTEGFGNNHIDFASHHEQVGLRDVPVVGCTFSALQGALVVGNEYMKNMIDLNKSKQGIENEILSNNTLCKEDAIRALAMLKTVMSGGEIAKANRKWSGDVKESNINLIKDSGKNIDLVENEQSLEKSKKRAEIYEAEDAK